MYKSMFVYFIGMGRKVRKDMAWAVGVGITKAWEWRLGGGGQYRLFLCLCVSLVVLDKFHFFCAPGD